jgi:hypothetical protein
MLRLILLSFFLSLAFISISQNKREKERIMTNESLILNITQLNWLEIPENMIIQPNSTEIGAYSMMSLVGKRYYISLATGFGFVAQNIKSNTVPIYKPEGNIDLEKIPDAIDYKTNKLTNVYFDIPLEVRIRTTPNRKQQNLKIAFGVLAGIKLQSYHKYEGEDYHTYSFGEYIKIKEYKIKNVLNYRYGVYARLGYDKFSLFGFYSLSEVFEENLGPAVTPYSLGISINMFFSKSYYHKYYRSHIIDR